MKKQILLRGALGFPIGVIIGYIITIIISLGWANGYYSPCVPALIEYTGSEISAVILQTFLCGVLGTSFSAISVIWEIEKWSIAKQTGIYFLLSSLTMLPIAYISYWMEHSFFGFLFYFGVFFIIFIVMWLVQYCIIKRKIQKLNEKINQH